MRDFSLGTRPLRVVIAAATLTGCGLNLPSAGTVTATNPIPTSTQYRVIHSFAGYPYDGAEPDGGLVNDMGMLFGTTYKGGKYNEGTVFAIAPSGAETVLHSFGGSGDGMNPFAGLVGVKGTLYGTTINGGASNAGTVFAITTSGKETVLHSFGGSGDGDYSYASLVNMKSTLYGTTYEGGSHNAGTVFAVTTSGKETVLHSFGGTGDGQYPLAGLIHLKGKLYGTTPSGGAKRAEAGTVYAVTTTGNETVLHSFGGSGDGGFPNAGVTNINGTLYGTTYSGGTKGDGTIFATDTSGKETVLYSFGPWKNGGQPYAGLSDIGGLLYGTTEYGGSRSCKPGSSNYYPGCGIVFAFTRPHNEAILHRFKNDPRDGKFPLAGVINLSGTLYGTTSSGGADNEGIVFSLRP